MKRAHRIVQTLTCICGLAIGLGLPDATLPRALAVETPMGTSFVYQGELRSGPSVVSTTDLKFRLYTAAIGGTQIGSELGVTGLNLVRGRFSVELDFGPHAFAAMNAGSEIDVGPPRARAAIRPLPHARRSARRPTRSSPSTATPARPEPREPPAQQARRARRAPRVRMA